MSKSGRVITSGSFISTPMFPWRELRAGAAESNPNAIITDFSDFDYATILAGTDSANLIDLQALFGNSFAGVIIGLYGLDVGANEVIGNTDKFGFQLLGYRERGGPSMKIAETANDGSSVGPLKIKLDGEGNALSDGTAYWADDITLSFSNWIGGVTIYDSGSDDIAWIYLDACGIKYLYLIISGANGASANESPGVGGVISVF